MLYHASPVKGLTILEPRVSNHEIPLIYFSEKRENVLVYSSNAVEKYCRETGFVWNGKWSKWGPYGFTKDKLLQLEEYYPNALEETYKGVSAYIYRVDDNENVVDLPGIPYAKTMDIPVQVRNCELIPDAYEAIMNAAEKGEIVIRRYEEMSPEKHKWLDRTIKEEYAQGEADYRHFLMGKFNDLLR